MSLAPMTHRERIQALYARQETDRVPYIHRGYGFCARNTGFALTDIYEDPKRSYLAQEWTAEQYDSDGEPFYTFVAYGSWEFGGEIEWPSDRFGSGPAVSKRPVSSVEDLRKLQMPDPKTAGSVPKMMEFAQIQAERGSQIAVIAGSPFTHAANLCGMTTFMEWLIDEPDAAHYALRMMTDHIKSVVDYFVDTFGKSRVLARSAAPSESNSLISPTQFNIFAAPYLRDLHQHALHKGVQRVYCHICGDQSRNLEGWQTVPFGEPGMLSFGKEVSIKQAAEAFPNDIICGNLDTNVIASGTPTEVYDQSRAVIEDGKRYAPGRFLFMSGCEIPASAPGYNIYMMGKAVRDFGQY